MDTKKQILVADDDVDYLFQIKLHLQNMGYEVVTVESQKEAEQILENTKPDLAIYDLMMETEDSGFVLSYKTKQKYPDVPVIIATAVGSETGISFGLSTEDEKKWIKADLYLEKDIRKEQLEKEIKKLLEQ
ncbi:MAG: response regulator [Bacteroidales bacterium]|nr:response regulator [Bacteroidales bacterium]MBS3774964.1 response regulator [Bacteroidales bacterium]